MTIIDETTAREFRPVIFDLYRDIHKGIRVELFAITADAGRLDPADRCGGAAIADNVRRIVEFLVRHAEHEDGAVQPALELHLPELAAEVAVDHAALEAQMDELVQIADTAAGAPDNDRRTAFHHLYVELAAFTSAYLRHQDVEEFTIMPALEAAIGVEAVVAVHGAIIGAIAPQEMAASLAIMLPAMNVDDRTEMLGGMKAGAPTEAFAAMWSLAGSVLTRDDRNAVAQRLGLD
jgi:Hemerythrin HHE cation binding domain